MSGRVFYAFDTTATAAASVDITTITAVAAAATVATAAVGVFVTHNLMICMNERQKCNIIPYKKPSFFFRFSTQRAR